MCETEKERIEKEIEKEAEKLLRRTELFLIAMAFLVAAVATLISGDAKHVESLPYFAIAAAGLVLSSGYAFMNYKMAIVVIVKAKKIENRTTADHTWLIPLGFIIFWLVMIGYYWESKIGWHLDIWPLGWVIIIGVSVSVIGFLGCKRYICQGNSWVNELMTKFCCPGNSGADEQVSCSFGPGTYSLEISANESKVVITCDGPSQPRTVEVDSLSATVKMKRVS